MRLIDDAHRDDPALDMALTGALLEGVADGSVEETVRVFRPGPTVALGRMDRVRPGFARACAVTLEHGWVPVLRWGGGHAAPYGPDCVVVEVIRRQKVIVGGLEERFHDLTALVSETVAGLGIDLEVGELPGEYCPGRFSLHLPGGPKVAGVAQRVIRGASLTTAALVVEGGPALRAVIADVYSALELSVDRSVAGALADGRHKVEADAVLEMMRERAAARYDAAPGEVNTEAKRWAVSRARASDPRSPS